MERKIDLELAVREAYDVKTERRFEDWESHEARHFKKMSEKDKEYERGLFDESMEPRRKRESVRRKEWRNPLGEDMKSEKALFKWAEDMKQWRKIAEEKEQTIYRKMEEHERLREVEQQERARLTQQRSIPKINVIGPEEPNLTDGLGIEGLSGLKGV